MRNTVLVHSPKYTTPLAEFGIDKPFALDRGTLVLQRLREEFGEDAAPTLEPEPISRADAMLVHTDAYLRTLEIDDTWFEIFELKPDEYDPSRATKPLSDLWHDIAFKSGGTKLAVELALKHNTFSANLGGGYHHAFPSLGRGFCALNDVAIAIRNAQKKQLCEKAMIVDVDFHQGDGTAVTFANDPSVFTFSIHSAEGWPDTKQHSDLDIEIKSSDSGDVYLERLSDGLDKAISKFKPDLVLFIAGSDPYELDVLPGTAFIKLTLDQMKARDEMVLDRFAQISVPLSMVYAGGYGPHVWEVHYWATKRLIEHSNIAA